MHKCILQITKKKRKVNSSEREEEKHRGTKKIIQSKQGRRREGTRCERGSKEEEKITRTSESDHIGKMSAPVRWQGEQEQQRQPDPTASLLWLCLEAKPKINTAAALRLRLHAPPTAGPAIRPPTEKPRKGKEIFLVWLTQDKYFVFASFPRQHLPFGFLMKACGSSRYSTESGP